MVIRFRKVHGNRTVRGCMPVTIPIETVYIYTRQFQLKQLQLPEKNINGTLTFRTMTLLQEVSSFTHVLPN